MIAIGGSIGTGLFLASGTTIATAGPLGALLSYCIVGLMVYFLMTSLGEMAAYLPSAGSFQTYGARFVDPAFGFALGWNYWFSWAITIAVELAATAIIMQYWFPASPGWLWSGLFLLAIVLLNYFSVRGFGEAEYWFSLFKVLAITLFILSGLVMIFGVLIAPHNAAAGLRLQAFAPGGATLSLQTSAFISVSLIVGFAFQGTELIGVAAGEARDPSTSIPRATRQIFWRIMLFYCLSVLVIGLIVPHNDPALLRSDMRDIGASPFTLVFERAGLGMAASLVNAAVLAAVLSCGNSGMFAATRMLYSMAQRGMAPAWLGQLSSGGVPRKALYFTTAIAALCFLSSLAGNATVYLWLLNAAGMTGFIAWLGIAVCHYRFRRALLKQGLDLACLPYKARWFPLGPVFAFILCLAIMLGQDYATLMAARIDWWHVLATYLGIPLFLTFWLGYKLRYKTRMVLLHEVHFNPQQSLRAGD